MMMTKQKNIIFLVLFFGLILFSCSQKISDFDRGKKFMELGDYDNAVKSFELAVWDQPDNPDIRYHLAEAFRKADNNRRAYRQYTFAAKIGSKAISERFTKWAWELFDAGDRDVNEIAKLAIIANRKNAEAQFLYGINRGYSGLPFLRDALDWSSDKKIVEPTFKLLNYNRTWLTNIFTKRLTTVKDGFEEFGPVVFSPFGDEIIWSRAQKNQWGRYRIKDVKLCARTLSDTTIKELTTAGTHIAFPVCASDSVTIYYSKGARIHRFMRGQDTTTSLMRGTYPDLSKTGAQLVFTRNWNIFISDTSGKTVKQLTRGKRYYDFNFMPKFIHPKDSIIIFLSYNDRYLSFSQIDTAGTKIKQIARISRYGFDGDRAWIHAYDISPDGKNIVFSRDSELFFLNIETGKEDTLGIAGAYPTFAPDGTKLTILTRGYGESGEVAIVNLDEVLKTKAFFKAGKAHRGKLLKLLKKVTENMEKEEFEMD